MPHISLISRIERYARNNYRWIPGGEYERLSIEAGYKASHGDRRCRDLVKAGILEKKIENGHVWYRYIQRYPLPQDMKHIESVQIEEPKAVEKVEAQGVLI